LQQKKKWQLRKILTFVKFSHNQENTKNYMKLYQHYKVDHAKAACFPNPPTRSKENRKSRKRLNQKKKKARFRNAYRESQLVSRYPTMKTQLEATHNATQTKPCAAAGCSAEEEPWFPRWDGLI